MLCIAPLCGESSACRHLSPILLARRKQQRCALAPATGQGRDGVSKGRAVSSQYERRRIDTYRRSTRDKRRSGIKRGLCRRGHKNVYKI